MIARLAMVAPVTVNCAVANWPPISAPMVVVPGAIPLASPVVEIVAMVGVDETHVTESVTSCVVPSARVAVALNCDPVPCAMVTGFGVIATEVRLCTESTAVWETPPSFTSSVADPAATPATAYPLGFLSSRAAIEPSFGVILHVVVRVIGCLVPSLKVPTAWKRSIDPIPALLIPG